MEDRDYNAFLSEVRASTDIVALVSEYVTLRKAGRRHKGLCPFHDEKTPSFSVDGDKGLFYCFGCQTGGDSFKFLMLREGMDFPETARVLGERLNLKPPERKGPGSDRRRRVYQVNTVATKFFRKCLEDPQQGKKARDYFKRYRPGHLAGDYPQAGWAEYGQAAAIADQLIDSEPELVEALMRTWAPARVDYSSV